MAPSIAPGSRLAGAAADQGCCYCACQQARANGLGHDGQGRAIQGTRRACGVNQIAPDNRRDVKVGRYLDIKQLDVDYLALPTRLSISFRSATKSMGLVSSP